MNPVAPARDLPMASSSSMKMMHGALSFACSKRSRTRAAPTPTNISTNSEPESVKNGTSASPATARARSVLPVPGGPTRSTPFGMRPPSRWYFFGFRRKSTISMSSAFASSTPATSANVVLSSLRSKILCLERPNDRACVGPPPTRRIRNIQIATMTPSGRTQPKKRSRRNVDSILRDLFFGWVLPLGVMVAIWMFLMRRVGGGPTQALSFGRSKHKIYDRKELKTTFADVAGVDEAKAELVEIVDFLRNPKKYQRLGGRIPKGVLLVGPPGTGKTLLARAVAGEADVPFFTLSGSEFVEMFVGVGAARVRDLFEQAKDKAPCIIFIDELDAIGKSRAGATGFIGGHDEREQTLNQLLAEMDGFDSSKGVILMAATNRPEVLDLALLRPGRFDRQVVVDKPDLRGREAILRLHARAVVLAPGVDLGVIAARTPGFAGADLANIVNEAALLAARKEKNAVEMTDFEEAIDRVVAGLEKKSRVLSEKERDIVATTRWGTPSWPTRWRTPIPSTR